MLYCPNCNHTLSATAPVVSCSVCGARFGEHSTWAPTVEPKGKPRPVHSAPRAAPQNARPLSWPHYVAKALVAPVLLLAALRLLYVSADLVIPGLALLFLAGAVVAVRSRQATIVLCTVSLALLALFWRIAGAIHFGH
jgi:hypothetical protein